MKKNKKFLCVISCLIPLIIGIYFYNKLPDKLPTHWDFNGNINGYTDKNIFIFLFPIVGAILEISILFFCEKDPKFIKNKNNKIYNLTYIFIPLLFNFIYISSIYIALGNNFDISKLIRPILGIVIVLFGNYLPTLSQNYTVGYKTPWALNDENNWKQTNRLAGKILIFIGFLMIISIFNKYILYIIIPLSIIPYIYSYYLYKN